MGAHFSSDMCQNLISSIHNPFACRFQYFSFFFFFKKNYLVPLVESPIILNADRKL
jgi:hypothetical protein